VPNLPTFSVEDRFWNDYRRLKRWKQARFTLAWQEFRDTLLQWETDGALGLPRFPAALRVKDVNGYPGIWELTWARDGRFTWEYGNQELPNNVHIV
jgi:hypothetical protein